MLLIYKTSTFDIYSIVNYKYFTFHIMYCINYTCILIMLSTYLTFIILAPIYIKPLRTKNYSETVITLISCLKIYNLNLAPVPLTVKMTKVLLSLLYTTVNYRASPILYRKPTLPHTLCHNTAVSLPDNG